MNSFVFLLPIIFLFVVAAVFGAFPALLQSLNGKKETPRRQNRSDYQREVDKIHITSDAESERKRRLDQLKSLYEAGMMEKDEYWERREGVEADYRA